MARRRGFSFRAYTRRRWRAASLLVVIMTGTLVYFAAADKGHDPLWQRQDGSVAALAISERGDIVYSALQEAGVVLEVRALDAEGHLLWIHDLNASGVFLAAGEGWVAAATPFPGAYLTVWNATDGALLHREFVQGNPRALAARGNHLALALQAPGNPVLLYRNLTHEETLGFRSFVISLALTPTGRLAAGSSGGELLVREPGLELLNTSRPFHIQSIRLSNDGSKLALGGFSIVEGDLSGAAEFFDLDDPVPGVPKWSYPTRLGVGFVDLSRDGARAIAVEERPPHYLVHYFDTRESRPRFSHPADGIVARDVAGATGGVSLSPDGTTIAVAALDRGGITLVSADDGEIAWRFLAEGSTTTVFAEGTDARFVANARLAPDRPYDATLLFDAATEPLAKRFPHLALIVLLAELAFALALVGLDQWWDSRR